ncbi:DUF1287 domain-containing protein [Lysobacter tyrosinilyticus]
MALLLVAALAACSRTSQPTATASDAPARQQPATSPALPAPALVTAARRQIGVTVRYDPAYVRLPYPGGDVAADRGVCTDVVIRAFRTQGLDLQQRVHEDMRAHFGAYPKQWGLHAPDANIDHRRVPNLQRWFERQRWNLEISARAEAYQPGDLVTWDLGGNVPHIGIVSERRSIFGPPLIIHNIGRGAREDNILFGYRITGHYRPPLDLQRVASTRE